MRGVEFEEADGKAIYVPGDDIEERHVNLGGKEIIFRLSNYADFAKEVMPTGKLDIKGVLTRYNNDWQFNFSSTDDIQPVTAE
jgi:hypothetical protein